MKKKPNPFAAMKKGAKDKPMPPMKDMKGKKTPKGMKGMKDC